MRVLRGGERFALAIVCAIDDWDRACAVAVGLQRCMRSRAAPHRPWMSPPPAHFRRPRYRRDQESVEFGVLTLESGVAVVGGPVDEHHASEYWCFVPCAPTSRHDHNAAGAGDKCLVVICD